MSHEKIATVQQIDELIRMADSQSPRDKAKAEEALAQLRECIQTVPNLWRITGDLALQAERQAIDRLSGGQFTKECIRRGLQSLREELGYDQSPAVERLLIEQIVLCYLRLHAVEQFYSNVHADQLTPTRSLYWEHRLSAAQQRYLRACEALQRVRKLKLPALQVNIASNGGRQLNVAGEVTQRGAATR